MKEIQWIIGVAGVCFPLMRETAMAKRTPARLIPAEATLVTARCKTNQTYQANDEENNYYIFHDISINNYTILPDDLAQRVRVIIGRR